MSEEIPVDKVPPYDEEAERCLLGSILMDYESCSEVISTLDDKAFYHGDHRKIFGAIRELFEESKPVDVVILNEQLKRKGDTGLSADYLVGLLESVPSAAHADYYCGIVRDKATLREIISACTRMLKECYGNTEGSEKLLDRAGELLLNLSLSRESSESSPISEVLQETFDRIEKLKAGQTSGLRTGFHELDQMTSGFQNSELIIIAGRPSMGKTSFAMNIAGNIAMQQQVTAAIFSLEVNKVQLGMNMLCAQARVNAQQVRRGELNHIVESNLFRAVGRLAESPIFIQDTPSLSIAEIRAQARRLKHQHDLGIVIIDYIQLMDGSRQRSFEGREKEISYISRGLKSIARELDVPVVALSQLSRQVESREGHRPRMSDLRESGSLEQDADVVCLLYREGYYTDNEDDRTAEVIVAKQRNGPTGSVRLVFNREYMRFDNPTAEDIT